MASYLVTVWAENSTEQIPLGDTEVTAETSEEAIASVEDNWDFRIVYTAEPINEDQWTPQYELDFEDEDM